MVWLAGTGCCHQPMRRKLHRGLPSCYVLNKDSSKKSKHFKHFFCLIGFFSFVSDSREHLCFVDLLIYCLSRVSFHPEWSHFISRTIFWPAQKNNTPQILPRLSSPETHNLIGRSWLDKLLKSKVDWLMAPIGWLPVPVAYPEWSPEAQKDRGSGSIGQSFNQSNPHQRPGSTARTFVGCSLIISEMITVAVWRPTFKAFTCTIHTQHISLPFPLSIYAQRRAVGAGGRVGGWDSLCAAASV